MADIGHTQGSSILISDALIVSASLHPTLATKILTKFNAEWLNVAELRAIFQNAQSFFTKFRTPPTPEGLAEFIKLEGKILEPQIENLTSFIQALPTITQPDFFEYQLEKVLQSKVLQKVIRDAAILHQQGQYDDIFRLFQRARSESHIGHQNGAGFWDDWSLRDISLLGEPSPTGFPSLDALLRGGIYSKEMMLVIGAKSAGKSWFASWVARTALFHNKFYVMVTMEMSRSDFLKRIDCAITNFDFDLYQENREVIRDIILSKKEQLQGNVHIVEYPSGFPTVPIIENELLDIEQRVGRKVDCVLIDYLDLMRGTVVGDGEEARRFGLISTAVEIRGMCGRNGMAAIVLKQSNALGKKRPFIEAENAAEAYGTAWAPDFVVSINEVVSRPDLRRIYVADSRRTLKKVAIPYKVDFGKAQWYEGSGF
jgi:hypothetical protein